MKYTDKNEFYKVNIFGLGQENISYSQYFVGNSYLNPLTNPKTSSLFFANAKHWHGAKKDSWFSRIAVEVPGENCSTKWYEEVDDTYYNNL